MDEIKNYPNPSQPMPPVPPPAAESKTPTFLLGVAVGCGSSFLLTVATLILCIVAISFLGGSANKTFSNVASAIGGGGPVRP